MRRLMFLFVLCLLLVRSPAQAGRPPLRAAQSDLDAGNGTQRRAAVQWPDLSYRQALRTPTFWALTMIAATRSAGKPLTSGCPTSEAAFASFRGSASVAS